MKNKGFRLKKGKGLKNVKEGYKLPLNAVCIKLASLKEGEHGLLNDNQVLVIGKKSGLNCRPLMNMKTPQLGKQYIIGIGLDGFTHEPAIIDIEYVK